MNLTNPKNPALLVAMPQLQDPNFRKAVVLIIDHSPEGALGFVVNNKSHMDLRGILADRDDSIPEKLPVWSGGPVVNANGVILHNESPSPTDTMVVPGVYLSADKSLIQKYIEHYANPQPAAECHYPYRFLVGYCGWGPGQLDAEIRSGSWIQASIDKEIIFHVQGEKIWSACIKAMGIKDENSLLMANNKFLN